MTIVLSCVNLKGGVGKTATAVNFAAYCGMNGFKTLLIDLDPQTNATFSCISPEKWSEHSKSNGTVANLLGQRHHVSAEDKQTKPEDVIIKNVFENVDLIPSHLDLFTIDLDIAGKSAREKLLRKALKNTIDDYDIIICDCPPNLTLPTQNALAISTHFVIPVSQDFLSTLGVALLIRRVKSFAEDLEIDLVNAGMILTRVGRKSNFREQTTKALRDQFKGLIFDSVIKERSSVTEATSVNKSIFQMNDAEAKSQFNTVFDELSSRLELT